MVLCYASFGQVKESKLNEVLRFILRHGRGAEVEVPGHGGRREESFQRLQKVIVEGD
jgi:hypothetical protein